MPSFTGRFSVEEWKLIGDCVREVASQDTLAAALASKTLKPLHDKILKVYNTPQIERKLGGAALRSHQKKLGKLAATNTSDKVKEARKVAEKVLREHGSINATRGQREAIMAYRRVTGCEFGIAKAATDSILEDLEEGGWK